jgi:acyl-CoA synthetase (NDP forming)
MTGSFQNSPLYKIANPGSVAFYGASNNPASMGTSILNSIQALGFSGRIYPVHPRETHIQGLDAFQTVQDLPETPDLAVLVLPTGIVAETLAACGQRGIRQAIVVSGGFTEVGEAGARRQKDIVAVAREHGIRFLGPNCIGVVNSHHKLNATFLPYDIQPGFIGMASQSGSFITQMFDYLGRYGLGFSTGFSVGNEADIDLVDCLQYLAQCPHTRVIALYIESIRRGREFISAARAIMPHKPIVAYYVGGSEEGRRAGFSHTGALAGPDRLYAGIFRQSGVIRADSIAELFDFCWVLGTCPVPDGREVIIQTHSGGPGAVAADACGRAGLSLPAVDPDTLAALQPYVPHTGSCRNPIDLTFTRNPLDYYLKIPEILLASPACHSVLTYFLVPSKTVRQSLIQMGVAADQLAAETEKVLAGIAEAIAALPGKHAKPFIGFSFRNREDPFTRMLYNLGLPVLPDPGRAARALAALVAYRNLKAKIETSESD